VGASSGRPQVNNIARRGRLLRDENISMVAPPSSSSQVIGDDTVAVGLGRGEYTEASVRDPRSYGCNRGTSVRPDASRSCIPK